MTYSLEYSNYFRSGAIKHLKGGIESRRKEFYLSGYYGTICIPVDRKAVNVGLDESIKRPPRLPSSIPKP